MSPRLTQERSPNFPGTTARAHNKFNSHKNQGTFCLTTLHSSGMLPTYCAEPTSNISTATSSSHSRCSLASTESWPRPNKQLSPPSRTSIRTRNPQPECCATELATTTASITDPATTCSLCKATSTT